MIFDISYNYKNSKIYSFAYNLQYYNIAVPISYIYNIENILDLYKEIVPIEKLYFKTNKNINNNISIYKKFYLMKPIKKDTLILKIPYKTNLSNQYLYKKKNNNDLYIKNNYLARIIVKYRAIDYYKEINLKKVTKNKNIVINKLKSLVNKNEIINIYINKMFNIYNNKVNGLHKHEEYKANLKHQDKEITINDIMNFITKPRKEILVTNKSHYKVSIIKNLNYFNIIKFLETLKKNSDITIFNTKYVLQLKLKSMFSAEGIQIYRKHKIEIIKSICNLLSKNNNKLHDSKYVVYFSKKKREFAHQYNNNILLSKKEYNHMFNYNKLDIIDLIKINNKVKYKDKYIGINRRNKYIFNINDLYRFHKRNSNNTKIYEYTNLINKRTLNLYKQYNINNVSKIYKDTGKIRNTEKFLIDSFYNIKEHINIQKYIEKYYKDLKSLNEISTELKREHQTFIEKDNDKMLVKFPKDITLSGIFKLVHKRTIKINIKNFYYNLSKQYKQTKLNKEYIVYKQSKYILGYNKQYLLYKQKHKSKFYIKNYFLQKDKKEIKKQKNIFLHDINKELNKNKDLLLHKDLKVINIDKDLSTEQIKEFEANIIKDNDMFAFKIQNIMDYDELANRVFADKDFREIYIKSSHKWLEGGEEEPDIKIDKFGIDELILPYNDYDYSILKDSFIDENGNPKGKYKRISNNEFLTKIPPQNPVPCFSDIGLEYIDVDVGILVNMTNVLYRLWRANVFKFGAMDIKDSMEYLLLKLKDYMELTFEGDDLKIASRVFRLFRWYAEMAMNKCCTYKITVKYKSLSSQLDKGDCNIPYTLNNMYIDTSKYIITNSVMNKECSVTFTIDNPIETKMTLSLYVSNDNALIYLNDKIYITANKGYNNFSIQLDKNDKSNEIRIYYNANNNGIIKVSNIVISDMIYNDIDVEYYSKVGEGNYFVNLLTKNLALTCMTDMYSNEEVEEIKNKNYSISVTLDKIKDYIDLHHVNKIKGKRFTIKKS